MSDSASAPMSEPEKKWITIRSCYWSAPEREPDGAWRITYQTSEYTEQVRLHNGVFRNLSKGRHDRGWTENAVTDEMALALLRAENEWLRSAAASPPAAGRRDVETAVRDTYSNALRDAALLLKRPPLTEAQEQAATEKYVTWYLPAILERFAAAPRSAETNG